MPSTKDVPVVASDTPQVIVKDLNNVVIYMWGDQNNTDEIYVGDSAVQRYVSGTSPQVGLPIVPFKSAVANFDQVQKVFVKDTNFFYMTGKKGDILHCLIDESEIFAAIDNLVARMPQVDLSPVLAKLDEIKAVVKVDR